MRVLECTPMLLFNVISTRTWSYSLVMLPGSEKRADTINMNHTAAGCAGFHEIVRNVAGMRVNAGRI